MLDPPAHTTLSRSRSHDPSKSFLSKWDVSPLPMSMPFSMPTFAMPWAPHTTGFFSDYAINNRLTPFISMQNHYNLIYREEEHKMMPMLKVKKQTSIWCSHPTSTPDANADPC
ncbi:hypothetical protein DFH94DRAFT_815555 [Russula ochroleuca]|uniref:Uncharacterized protein n=1 Tax=Russula ochroleuca TaxID=152965 RepID=A0A9P5N3H0_9AGAM|nr:hypothetical protein DFH94DRAFT_815555 [Russula ochroleuca]